ncbi:MAG: SDR family oxidoreductase [Pseudomonadota bacterium]
MTENNPQVAIVTGAGKRIGRQIALSLAQAGWAVGVHYNISAGDAETVVAEIKAAGGEAVAIAANLAEAGAVDAIVPRCRDALGPPSLLVNNASLFVGDEVGTLGRELWHQHMDINLQAPVFLAEALANQLPDGVAGNVINIIDQRVWKLTPMFFSYTLSKSALWTATRTLAQALAPRVRVNAIGPGPAIQSIHQTDEQFSEQCQSTPLHVGTSPHEIAAAVLFLLDAPAMTGQMIALDGGQHLAWQTPDVEYDA